MLGMDELLVIMQDRDPLRFEDFFGRDKKLLGGGLGDGQRTVRRGANKGEEDGEGGRRCSLWHENPDS